MQISAQVVPNTTFNSMIGLVALLRCEMETHKYRNAVFFFYCDFDSL